MDYPFLRSMSVAYMADNPELSLSYIKLYDELVEVITNFRNKYPSILTEVREKDRRYQQKIIYSFFDSKFKTNQLEEDDDVEVNISENIFMRSYNNISNAVRNLFRSRPNFNDEEQFLISVITNNYDNCNRLCSYGREIPNNVLMSLLYLDMKSPGYASKRDNILNRVLTRRELNRLRENNNLENVSKCLRYCYLDYLTTIYAEGILNYEICKREVGGENVTLRTPQDILRAYPVDSFCEDIYTTISNIFLDINRLLNYIYADDSIKKKKWIDVIFNKLENFRRGQDYKIDFSKIDDTFEYPTDYVQISKR